MLGSWRLRHWRFQRRQARLLAAAQRAVARFPNVRAPAAHGLPGQLIVSLTSYPARFPTLALTLRSLLDQEVKADRTVLWIAANHIEKLPTEVNALTVHGLEIRPCVDVRSFTKLVPALIAWPNAFIATADDDIYYPPHWLRRLVETFDAARPEIVAWRAHLALIDAKGRLEPYWSWPIDTPSLNDRDAGALLFPTGVGGVLYPPGAFDSDVLDDGAFLRLCPTADDLWFFWMAEQKGTPQRRVDGRFELVPWQGSQDITLFSQNVLNEGNDAQIRALETEIGLVGTALSSRNAA